MRRHVAERSRATGPHLQAARPRVSNYPRGAGFSQGRRWFRTAAPAPSDGPGRGGCARARRRSWRSRGSSAAARSGAGLGPRLSNQSGGRLHMGWPRRWRAANAPCGQEPPIGRRGATLTITQPLLDLRESTQGFAMKVSCHPDCRKCDSPCGTPRRFRPPTPKRGTYGSTVPYPAASARTRREAEFHRTPTESVGHPAPWSVVSSSTFAESHQPSAFLSRHGASCRTHLGFV